MPARSHVVFELDGQTLSAVKAVVRGESINVKAWRSEDCPSAVEATDERALIEWASKTLASWKLGAGRIVCCVPRAEVVLKRLHLSGAAGASDDDRAGIVSLQMGRQLSLSMQDPAVDYVPILGDDGVLDVIAGALPGSRLAMLRTITRGKLARAGLRSEGVGALVAGTSPDETGAVLGVSLGSATTDFVIVEGGELRFARAADARRLGAEPDAYARQIAVEAKRTWMSYRMGGSSLDVERVIVLGAGDLAARVAERCEVELETPTEALERPPFVTFDDDMSDEDRRASMPLVGLIAQELIGSPTLNFAAPRKAADRHASTRQRALLGVFAVIVLAGAGYLFAKSELRRLDQRRTKLLGEYGQLQESYYEALRRQARAEHAEAFVQAEVDWIDQIAWLNDVMPDPNDAILNQLRASLDATVAFRPRVIEDEQGRRFVRYTGGQWSHAEHVTAVIEGDVRARSIADALRETFLADGVYTVDTRGPDDETSFSFELGSSDPGAAEARP